MLAYVAGVKRGGGEAKRGWREGDNAGYTGVWEIEKLIGKYFYSRGATLSYLEKFILNRSSSIRVNLLHPCYFMVY